MSIRKQTLEEWFTDYQLRALAKRHYHIPFDLEVDVSRLVSAYADAGRRAPFTALVVKAAALLALRCPEVNRVVLRTPLGARVVQFDEAHVNMTVAMAHEGRKIVSAVVLRRVDALSIEQIEGEIQKARARKIDDLPIARRIARSPNTARHRLALAARHFLAYSVPQLYEKHGGGISVSSLVRAATPGVTARIPSYGPTALTICPGALRTEGGRSVLFIGVGYDHVALPGQGAVRATELLGELLCAGDPAHFGPSLPAPSPAAPLRRPTQETSKHPVNETPAP